MEKKNLTTILEDLMEYLSDKKDLKEIIIKRDKTNIIIKREVEDDRPD